jgi:NAD(P)-dependent dehydrogenase (short-subunit alcohol dehydrogenase family)
VTSHAVLLVGKNFIVTGGTQGLGRTITEQ